MRKAQKYEKAVLFPLPLEKAGLVFLLKGVKKPIDEALAECLEVFKKKFNKDPEVLELEQSLYEGLKAALGGAGKQFTWRGITVESSSDLPEGHLYLYFHSSINEDWEIEF